MSDRMVGVADGKQHRSLRRVVAEFGCDEVLHVRIDVAGVPEPRLSTLAEKLGQIPTVLSAYWHRL